jgi:hypothetical protein
VHRAKGIENYKYIPKMRQRWGPMRRGWERSRKAEKKRSARKNALDFGFTNFHLTFITPAD